MRRIEEIEVEREVRRGFKSIEESFNIVAYMAKAVLGKGSLELPLDDVNLFLFSPLLMK